MKAKLPNATTWSNGNAFRALTLLAATFCEQQRKKEFDWSFPREPDVVSFRFVSNPGHLSTYEDEQVGRQQRSLILHHVGSFGPGTAAYEAAAFQGSRPKRSLPIEDSSSARREEKVLQK